MIVGGKIFWMMISLSKQTFLAENTAKFFNTLFAKECGTKLNPPPEREIILLEVKRYSWVGKLSEWWVEDNCRSAENQPLRRPIGVKFAIKNRHPENSVALLVKES